MKKQNSIKWSKWVNVMSSDSGDQYIPESDVNIDVEKDQEYEGEVNPVVITPLGMIPLQPFNDPTKVFNFWLGETNFPLSKKRGFILNNIPGVEILDIFTKYKFRIAIGNNFDFQEVKSEIEKVFKAYKEPTINKISNKLRSTINKMIDLHLKDFSFWSIYILPNDKINFICTNNEYTFKDKLNFYQDAHKLVGGIIIGPGEKF